MNTFISKLYKSQEGKHTLHNLYRKYMLEMRAPVRERMVETRFGLTHISMYGNPSGKPVLTFYGKNAINPLAVSPLVRGLDMHRFQLIVPDPVNCIGFSDETKSQLSDREYGEWAAQVATALELPCVAVIGYSFGAAIALRLCMMAPSRIERLLLFTPSRIMKSPTLKWTKLARFVEKEDETMLKSALLKTLTPLTISPHDMLTEMMLAILLHACIRKEKRKPLRNRACKKMSFPVYLVAEKSDSLFPGHKLIKKAKKKFPRGITHLTSTGAHYGFFDDEAVEKLTASFDAMSAFLSDDIINLHPDHA